MTYFYMEKNLVEIELIVESIVVNSDEIYDQATKTKFLKIGAGFDIETSKIPLDKNLFGVDYTAFCYHWQFGLGDIAIMGRSLDTMKEFYDFLINTIKKNKPKRRLIVLDANFGYEWQFCKYYWKDFKVTKLFAKEKRKPLRIEFDESVLMMEVLGLFGSSLADIAATHTNMEKLVGDLDYDKPRNSTTELTTEEIDYCVRDVEILVELATSYIYINYMGTNEKIPLTKTSIVRSAVKKAADKDLKRLQALYKQWMPTEAEYEIFRLYLFKGGISGSNIRKMNRVYSNSIKGADITSDYPYQMLTKKYPYGKATVCENSRFMTDGKPYIAAIRFINFRSLSEHALMSSHKALNSKTLIKLESTVLDNNRIQFGEVVELILNDVEYRALKAAYKWDDAVVTKCWVFEEGYKLLPQYVRKTVIEWYLKKERLKEDYNRLEHDAPDSEEFKEISKEYKQAKAFVNSIFGMMCTALYMEDFQFIEEKIAIDIPTDEDGNPIFKSYDEACDYLFLSPYWGFWITSYAREMLIDVITKYHKCIIQYDTDSVYYDTNEPESTLLEEYLMKRNRSIRAANDIRFLSNPRLMSIGTWDFTPVFKRFKALGAKRYMYEYDNGKIKVVIAGHRKNKKGRPTLLDQCDFNNAHNGTNIDYFDFFTDKMVIDKEHSNKLCSRYVDEPIRVNFTDYQGNTQEVFCPAAIVLEPIEFRMKMGKTHKELMLAVERYLHNSRNQRKKVYEIWKELKR